MASSPGKSLLLQMREERHRLQAEKDAEFARAAQENYEYTAFVRTNLTNKARGKGNDGGIFSSNRAPATEAAAVPQQSRATQRGAPFAVDDRSYDAKENYAAPYGGALWEEDDTSSAGLQQGRAAPPKEDAAAKYDAMLKAAQMKRIREKASPRSTSFY